MRPVSRERKDETRGLALVLLSTVGYGTMPILGRLAYADGVGVAQLLFWRFLIATGLFGTASRGRALTLRMRLRLWALGVVFVVNAVAYFLALARIPVSTLSLLIYTYPVIVTLLSALAGIEPLTPRNLLSGALAFCGVALTAGGAAPGEWTGVLLALTSAFVYSCYVVLGMRFARDVRSEVAAQHVAQAALVIYAAWALSAGELRLPPSPRAALAIFVIAAFSTVLALRAFLSGLQRIGPSRAAVLSSFEVIVTIALAVVFLGERLTTTVAGGGLLILGAVALQHFVARRP
jgi:drug/metabolite transporter (DMT)-like permease